MLFAAALTLAAILGKQACGLAVVEKGLDRLSVGLGMVPRGEVGLIFAGQGKSAVAGRRARDLRLHVQRGILSLADRLPEKARGAMEDFALHSALAEIWAVVAEANRYFASQEPWVSRASRIQPHGDRARM